MNNEDYVSLEVAKLLKEKGYDEECYSAYDKQGRIGKYITPINWNREYSWALSRPTLYEAKKWIWQSHNLLTTAFIKEPFGQPYEFIYCIQDAKNTIDDYGTIVSDKSFDTYEEALNSGILEALKLI